MILREERDPAWWQAVADHPEVAPHLAIPDGDSAWLGVLAHPDVTPLAAKHGGLWFHRHGGAHELHAFFTPDGWGGEANAAFKASYEVMIDRGAERFTVTEVWGLRNSRPPLSHGWRLQGDFGPGPCNLTTRPWAMTPGDWRRSPAYRRMTECRQS